LTFPGDRVRDQAIYFLGIIARDSPKARDFLLDFNVMEKLLALIRNLSTQRNATWAVSILMKGKPQPDVEKVKITIPDHAQLFECKENRDPHRRMLDVIYVEMTYLKLKGVVEVPNVVQRLCDLLHHKVYQVQIPVLSIIGNITSGTDLQTEKLLNAGVLTGLAEMVSHKWNDVVKQPY
jgi:importin subunit alpha-1